MTFCSVAAKLSSTTIALAPESSSWCFSSRAVYSGLVLTTIRPARSAPNRAIGYCSTLGIMIATRSPLRSFSTPVQIAGEVSAEAVDFAVAELLAHVGERGPVAELPERLVQYRGDRGVGVDVDLLGYAIRIMAKPRTLIAHDTQDPCSSLRWSAGALEHTPAYSGKPPPERSPMIRHVPRMMLLLPVFWLMAGLAGCHHPPDETRVREAIARTADAAEAGRAGDVADALSDDFNGNEGELDPRRLVGLLRMVTLRGDHVGVTLGPVDVRRQGDRMMADFTATLTSGGRLLPSQLGVYKVQTAWRREHGDWVCYWAHWTRPL